MISAILLNLVYLFASGIVALFRTFGTVSTDSNVTQGIATISTYLSPLNDILPLDTIVAILIFELVFEGLYFTYKLIRWGYKKVPTIS